MREVCSLVAKPIVRITLLLVLSLLLSACATISFSDSETRQSDTVAYDKTWSHLFLDGYVGFDDIKTICPEDQKVSQFQVQLTPAQGGIRLIPWFLVPYSPVTASYWCE